ncbi:hypothetical protein PRUPE_7G212200 [Prunus persica]|uniref:Uncharacterized protein n=1 Tax=Prunus persica TaxID=3760 RepID=M5W5V0_PRUPE|nr:hypothetical protein PRUPE_7G212200 [Prunus persica]
MEPTVNYRMKLLGNYRIKTICHAPFSLLLFAFLSLPGCLIFFSTVVTVRSYVLIIKHSIKLYSCIKETFTFVIKSLVQINHVLLCFASAFVQGFLLLNYH